MSTAEANTLLEKFGPEACLMFGLRNIVEALEVIEARPGRRSALVSSSLATVREIRKRFERNKPIKAALGAAKARLSPASEQMDAVVRSVRSDGKLSPWIEIPSYYSLITRGDRRLGVSLTRSPTGGPWTVVALEMPSAAHTAEAIFDAHNHKIVGERDLLDGPGGAKALAETYAKQWAAGEIDPSPPCPCEEIGVPAS